MEGSVGTRGRWTGPAVIIFLATTLVLGAVLSASVQEETPRPKPGGELRVRPFGSGLNTDLDPAGNGYSLVVGNLYEGLVRLDQNLNIIPGLADYWSVSENGKKVTFYLRKNAFFHNGQAVTAADVKFSFERLFRLKSQPVFYEFASRIEGGEEFWEGLAPEVSGLRIAEDKTLEIYWLQPSITNFYFLAAGFAGVLPAGPVQSQKKRFFEKPVGSGPFKFDYWLRNRRLDVIGIRLVRNENYFARKPFLEAVEVSPFFQLEDFFQNEIQVIPYLTFRISRDRYQVLESNLLQLDYLFFSCHLPPFDRPEVRRALEAFLEKRQLAGLASTSANFCQVMDSFIPPFLPGFVPEGAGREQNLSQVLKVLEEAGLGRMDKPLVVHAFFQMTNKDLIPNIYGFLREELKAAGIKLELKTGPSVEELARDNTPYIFYLQWSPDLPDPEFILWPLFHSAGSLNRDLFHYKSSKIDELLELQRNGLSFERRINLFREIEKILRVDSPGLPLFFHKQRLAYQPYLKNLKAQPQDLLCLNLRDAWIDR
ncbi:MAG: ABC transporter substrate-binding protein [Candidatus Saccharicenans sp.]|nr:ABC transporter substrate-binding protein [Candidatus Saccharicenans sp.]MDI6849737.1 ABC transporter substrate-binding protein [Candidatus Saccharicenans sp.]